MKRQLHREPMAHLARVEVLAPRWELLLFVPTLLGLLFLIVVLAPA